MARNIGFGLQPAAYILALVGLGLVGYGIAFGAPEAEHPDCTNNICKEVEYMYKCTPVTGGFNYLHSDCLFCANSSGRCIDVNDGQSGPEDCQASLLFNQSLRLCDVETDCDCGDNTAYVEAHGDATGMFTPIGRAVYNCN